MKTLLKAVGTTADGSHRIELFHMVTLTCVEKPSTGFRVHSQESMSAGKVFSMSRLWCSKENIDISIADLFAYSFPLS